MSKPFALAALLVALAVPAHAQTPVCPGSISLAASPLPDGHTELLAHYEEFPVFASHSGCTRYTGVIYWSVTYCASWLDDSCEGYYRQGPDSTPPSTSSISFRPLLPGLHLVLAILDDLPALTPDGLHPNPDRVKKVMYREVGPMGVKKPPVLRKRAAAPASR